MRVRPIFRTIRDHGAGDEQRLLVSSARRSTSPADLGSHEMLGDRLLFDLFLFEQHLEAALQHRVGLRFGAGLVVAGR